MGEKETSRLEAFSDGVFAVAITLLILNIGLPEALLRNLPGDKDLWQALGSEWPAFAAYTVSFLNIGIMWLNHHRLFVHIKRVNTALIFINLMLLITIVFLPFPTSLLADYILSPNDHAAAVFYSGICLLMACCFDGLWLYASYHNRLLGKNGDTTAIKAISRQYLLGPLFYLLVFGVAWINTILCVVLTFALALFFALPSRAASSLVAMKIPANIVNRENEQIEEQEL